MTSTGVGPGAGPGRTVSHVVKATDRPSYARCTCGGSVARRRRVPQVVADVREVRLTRGDALGRGEGLIDVEVRRMRPLSQRVDHEHVDAVDERHEASGISLTSVR